MSIRLTNVRKLGRFRNKDTGQEYNVHKGRQVGRSVDMRFYLFRNKRVWISDPDFYHKHEPVQDTKSAQDRSTVFGYLAEFEYARHSRKSKGELRDEIRETLSLKQGSMTKADMIYLIGVLSKLK
jgi:hypothetical protein